MAAFRFFDPWAALDNADEAATPAKAAKLAKVQSSPPPSLATLAALADPARQNEISADCRARLSPALSRPCPDGVLPERWERARQGVERFAEGWAGQAIRLGWTFEELFTIAEPFARVDLQGAAWFVGDTTIAAVSVDAITLCTAGGATQRIYRRSLQ